MEVASPRFSLPSDEPIDGHVLTWFEVTDQSMGTRVVERRMQYHAHTAWDTLYPTCAGQGVDVIDSWMTHTEGHPEGRVDGWRAGVEWLNRHSAHRFTTRNAALVAARITLEQSIARTERRLSELRAQLANLK